MIGGILLSLIGGPIAKILISGWKAKLDAANASERIAADIALANIEAGIQARKNATEIRLATAGFWEMRLLTAAIATPFVAHLWAVSLDTVFELGWGIPAFPAPFDSWEGSILLSFFGVAGAVSAVRAISSAIAMRGR